MFNIRITVSFSPAQSVHRASSLLEHPTREGYLLLLLTLCLVIFLPTEDQKMESSGKAGGDDAEVSQSVTFFSLEF